MENRTLNIEQLKARYQELIAQAKALSADEKMSTEASAQFDGLMSEADGVKAEWEAIEASDARKARLVAADKSLDIVPPSRTESRGVTTIEVGHDNRVNDPKCGFTTGGEFYQAIVNDAMGSRDERLDIANAATGLTGSNIPDGGAVIPTGFSSTIYSGMQGMSDNLLNRCTVIPMGNEDEIKIPRSGEVSRANGSRWGGVRGYWVDTEEGQSITASKPSLARLTLHPHEVAAVVYAANKSLRNSAGALESYLNMAAPDELNFQIGNAITNGTGAGQPKGFANSGAVVAVAKEGSQTAATINRANIQKMYRRMPAALIPGAVWLVGQDSLAQIDDLQGGDSANIMLTNGTLTAAPHGTLKGLPVVPSEYAAALGSQGDITLVNMRHYAAAVKGGLQSAQSMHISFLLNESAFRFIMEVDGQPFAESPLTPLTGTDTLSAFVALAVRA